MKCSRLVFALVLTTGIGCAGDGVERTGGSSGDGSGGGGGGGGGGGAGAAPGGGSGAGGVLVIDAAISYDSGEACSHLDVEFEQLVPTVVLLVDESGSMSQFKYPTDSSPTDRWMALHDALMSTTGIVSKLQHDVRFGLTTFTGDGTAAGCPILDRVPIALDNYNAIAARYPATRPSTSYAGETPTGVSVRAVTADLAADMAVGPKYIIIATDGEPDTCARPNPQCGQEESLAAVQAAYAQGIGTFVIGISSDVGDKHLQDLANAGVGLSVLAPDMSFYYNCPKDPAVDVTYGTTPPSQNAPFFHPLDQSALGDAINTIINSVRTCSFQLYGKVTLSKADRGTVLLDGLALPFGDPDGWNLSDETHLQITGRACDQIKTGSKMLAVSFPCDTVVPIPK